MQHIRTPRAAVAADSHAPEAGVPTFQVRNKARAPILWASRPLRLRNGRAVAVRLVSGAIEVAVVEPGTSALRWMAADRVMTESQAIQWSKTANFTRSR